MSLQFHELPNRDIAFEYHLRRLVRDGGIVDLNAPLPDNPDVEIMRVIYSAC